MMRYFSVSHLRLLILVINVLLAGGLIFKVLGAYKITDLVFDSPSTEEESSGPKIVSLDKFEYREQDFGSAREGNSVQKLAIVGSRLQPVKPKPVSSDPGDGSKPSDEPEAGEEETFAGGPLEEDGWEYIQYIHWPDDPQNNLVQIRKKQEKRTTGRTVQRTSSRGRTPPRRSRPQRSKAGTRASKIRKPATDSISFVVSDRWVTSEEFELDFKVESADMEKLVYWIDDPKKMYALKYQPSEGYLGERGRDSLGPLKNEDEEKEKEEGEEEKKNHFFLVDRDYDFNSERERDYQNHLKGLPVTGALKARKIRSSNNKARSPARTPRSTTNRSTRTTARPSSTKKKSVRKPVTDAGSRGATRSVKKPTAEEVKKLGEAMKNATPEDKKKLKDALTGSGSE